MAQATRTRHLVVVLGDQLDREGPALDGFEPARDAVWMAEAAGEATHVWSHRQRIALFLSAMRHFRDDLRARGWPVDYRELTPDGPGGELGPLLAEALARHRPERVILTEPGEWRVWRALEDVCASAGVPLEIRPDRHFYASREDFRRHAAGRQQLRLEYFYRELRRREGVLLEPDGQPAGGQWNYDADNRAGFGRDGPGDVPPGPAFPPDATTRAVLELVGRRFAAHPGRLDNFAWPVTPAQARAALDDFITHRLPRFGLHQDAMWTGQPFLWHARLAAALNLKMLDPRAAVRGAEEAWRAGHAPLAAAEGFIRQILGWREYVRGVYWHCMPGYLEMNALGAAEPLPEFFWTGRTPLVCLRETIGQTLEHAYAHHIQRLMVTGLYALLLGVRPQAVHEWYLAVYVDAVEWVELPNTLGMSQYGDGGLLASKPYVASGKYLDRMSNYCGGCPARPDEATGPRACPFTTLYWDFLLRHEERFRQHPRMQPQLRNLARLAPAKVAEIRERAARLRADPAAIGLFPAREPGLF